LVESITGYKWPCGKNGSQAAGLDASANDIKRTMPPNYSTCLTNQVYFHTSVAFFVPTINQKVRRMTEAFFLLAPNNGVRPPLPVHLLLLVSDIHFTMEGRLTPFASPHIRLLSGLASTNY